MAEGKVGIDVPLDDLSQVTTLGKNELNLEFHQETNIGADDEVISEMRLALPTGDVVLELSAEALGEQLQKRTGLSATGEALARIPEVTVTQPRGKHDFEFFAQAVKVHGKTQNYTIKYTSISKAFLLELPPETLALVIHLDPPMRHGVSQVQNYLALSFDKERTLPVELPDDLLKAMHYERGQPEQAYTLMTKLVKHFSNKAVISPTSEFSQLLQKDGECAVRCSMKTQPGFLCPTKRSMLFVMKPVIAIKYDEIEYVAFNSSTMRKSSFDLVVATKSHQVYEFSQFERDKVMQALFTWFQKVEVKIENPGAVEGMMNPRSTARTSKSLPGRAPDRGQAADEEDKDDDYDEDADDDFDEDEADGDEDSSVEEAELEDDDEPKKKRPRRSK